MTPLRLLALSAFALALPSCSTSSREDGDYDTSNPYGTPQYGDATAAADSVDSVNPIYDTPAAYEEASPTAPAPDIDVVDPGVNAPRSNQVQAPSVNTSPGGTTHLVVKGDTLGGIARKYGVSMDAIKRANSMTKDTVVLGKTLKIPAR
jgi:LysM repeat protein